jgi:hypothetical protein
MMRRIAAAIALAVALLPPPAAGAGAPEAADAADDHPLNKLQKIVDARYGAGHIHVATDYVGAHPGDIDPWFWVGDRFSTFLVRKVGGKSGHAGLAWYEENGVRPGWPGGGIVLDGAARAGTNTVVAFGRSNVRFGFMMISREHGPNGAPDLTMTFTNRLYNDAAPNTPAPSDPADPRPSTGGSLEALIFDVSPWSLPNTWLVCFEEHGQGAAPGPRGGCAPKGDFDDLVFEVVALGATPVKAVTFGGLKDHYRH